MRCPYVSFYVSFLTTSSIALSPTHHIYSNWNQSPTHHGRRIRKQAVGVLFNHNKDNHSPNDDENCQSLQTQIQKLQVQILETELSRPPHHPPNLSPQDFILEILQALYRPHYPLNDSGFRVLLRSSTPKWRRSICQSIGVDVDDNAFYNRNANVEEKINEIKTDQWRNDRWDEDKIASSLQKALSSPKNQFGILVGPSSSSSTSCSSSSSSSSSLLSSKTKNKFLETRQNQNYKVSFPSDIVDFNDGTCWLECRLVEPKTGKLMVIMGWQLQRQNPDNLNCTNIDDFHCSKKDEEYDLMNNDGAWFIDGLDWQDFRDMYRPGIGREEWMRICG